LPTSSPISALLSDGTNLFSTHEGLLAFDFLPLSSRRVHLFPDSSLRASLIGIGIFTDAGFKVIYDSLSVQVIISSGIVMLQGTRASIIQWLTEHRGAANQNFEVLATHLCQIELVTQSLAAPSTGIMYPAANQVFVPSELVANATTVSAGTADLIKAIQSLVVAMSKGSSPSSSSARVKISSTEALSGYCWTHGYCAHSSASCKKPAQGHVSNATAASHAGGNNAKWVRPIK
jgi:hypothetical protein